MLFLSQIILKIAAGLYGLTLLTAFVFSPRRGLYGLMLLPALAANAAAVVLRYQLAWPMLPMYLGPYALPLLLGMMTFIAKREDKSGRVRRLILLLTLITTLMAILFPKDFYLPFLKSQSVAAHLFFLFGVTGRACFLVSAAWAVHHLFTGLLITDLRPVRWSVWGFAFWTLSIFSGELWSYLGWGTPVVWDDPAITTVMATWFYYACLLHLHLIGSWDIRSRTIYAAAGAVVVLSLNCLPEWGPFRWPF